MYRISLKLAFFALLSLFFAMTFALPSPGNVIRSEQTLVKRSGGRATWFNVGLGACGQTNVNSDLIVALSPADYANGAHCGQQISITDPSTGRAATATVRDLCPGCPSGALDMSPALFIALASDLNLGVFQMTWNFI